MKPRTLRATLSALRDPETGCPWDLKQTHQSLAKYLREEAGECLDALAAHQEGDSEKERHLCEELGDLWLQIAFHAQLAQERGAWDLHDVEQGIVEKLWRRHPHVFAESSLESAEEVQANWAALKLMEKAERGEEAQAGLLEGMAKDPCPLSEAIEIGNRCATVGFEWPDLEGVLDKVKEELAELQAESDPQRVEEEFGDVLFSLMQWARRKQVDPERALRRQMQRFRERFRFVETFALANGGWVQHDLKSLDAAWIEAKHRQRGSKA